MRIIIIIIIILHFMVIQHSIPIPLMSVSLLKKQRHMMNEMLTGWDKGLCSIGVFQMSHVKIEDMHDAPTTSYRKPCRKTIKFILLFILKGFKGPKDSFIRRTVLPQDSWPCDTPCQVLPVSVYLQKTLSLGISFMSTVVQQIIALHSLTLCIISPCVYMNSCTASVFSSFCLSRVTPAANWFVIQNFSGFLRCPSMWKGSGWPWHNENATPKPDQTGLP